MIRLSVVVGNPKPDSRTLHIAEALATRVASRLGAELTPSIDLARHGAQLFDPSDEEVAELARRVGDSDLVVVASPTYKASYTGLLKAFLDRYPNDGLAGVTAIAVMTVGSPYHALAVDFTLRPLLVELGASVPTRGLNFFMSDMDRMDDVLDDWAAANLRSPGMFGPLRGLDAEVRA